MRHRPPAGGTIDHNVVGLLSMVFAVLVGIGGALLSLLLRWPGLGQAGSVIRLAAQAHVPLLVFFAFIPASLGGLAVAGLPSQVGSNRSAFPGLDIAALVLTIAALGGLVAGACGLGNVGIGLCACTLAIATVFGAANLIATGLIERTVAYARLPISAWTTLIAAGLILSAAPIMAARYSVALWRGVPAESALAGLIWPALLVAVLVILGVVTDILADGRSFPRASAYVILALLGGGTLVSFMAWAYCLENRIVPAVPFGVLQALLLLLLMPILLVWTNMLFQNRGTLPARRLPALFAAGFVAMMLVGLTAGVTGMAGHEAISLAVVFGLLAGFFRMTENKFPRPVALWSAQAQFWLLLGGSLSLLLPMPPVLKALGAAMSTLSVVLFAAHLVAALVYSRSVLGHNRFALGGDHAVRAGGSLS